MKQLEFYECENWEDLEDITSDLINSGAEIINTDINCDEEIGLVIIKTDNFNMFMEKFKTTNSFHFLN